MHYLVFLLIFIGLPVSSLADLRPTTDATAVFTQEVLAINADGSFQPAVDIHPDRMPGMHQRDFSLGLGQTLRIITNVSNAEERGLSQVVETVRRAYAWVESHTGRRLQKGVLLYLVEMDVVPFSYRFEAAYHQENPWAEVRLALIRPKQPLIGAGSSRQLNELLFDTIPHELGHDILNDLPQLAQDLDNGHQTQTRWFAEGACEFLAKSFSLKYAPFWHQQFVNDRNLGRMLHQPDELRQVLTWGQHDGKDAKTESDYYGGALLLVNAWSSAAGLHHIIETIADAPETVEGHGLLQMVEATTGWPQHQFVTKASGGKPAPQTSQSTMAAYNGG